MGGTVVEDLAQLGYIEASTRNEIAHARTPGKPVTFTRLALTSSEIEAARAGVNRLAGMSRPVRVNDEQPARRYVIAATFRGLKPGEEFARSQWPLHVTLVANFRAAASVEAMAAGMHRALAHGWPRRLEFGGAELFGPHGDIPVRLVRSTWVTTLHGELVAELRATGDIVADAPHYWGEGYRPHVTLIPPTKVDAELPSDLSTVVFARLDGAGATVLRSVGLAERMGA